MTTRTLVLIRHAKAEAGGASDADRILAPRGTADAAAIGRWLAAQGLGPERIVVSPARRARQTWDLAAAELATPPSPVVDERIYDNTVDDLLAVVGDAPADVATLVLVGHNPSMAELAFALDDGTAAAGARAEMARNYPTSAIAVFAVAGDWAGLRSGAGRLVEFAAPRGGRP